jgi:hypothetical protein
VLSYFFACAADKRPHGLSDRSGSLLILAAWLWLVILGVEAVAAIADGDVAGRILQDPRAAGVAALLASLVSVL